MATETHTSKETRKAARTQQTSKPPQPQTVPWHQVHPRLIQRAIEDPSLETLTPEVVRALQRTHGNQFVQRLVRQAQEANDRPPPLPVQAKFTVTPAGDQYEREADSVAKQVVNAINAPAAQQAAQRQAEEEEEEELQMQREPLVQRQAEEEEEEELQMQREPLVQRQAEEEEEELQMQREPLVQRQADLRDGGEVEADLEASIQRARGGGQPIPGDTRVPMEQAFGADFSGVRVHSDAQSDALSQSLQAQAFTTGQDIFFKQGLYNPGNSSGRELLAHELTHVVQQTGGQVQRKEDPEQPQVAVTISDTRAGVVQRAVENEHLLTVKGWKKASKRWWRIFKRRPEDVRAIERELETYQEAETKQEQVMVLGRISGLADALVGRYGNEFYGKVATKLRNAADDKANELKLEIMEEYQSPEKQEERIKQIIPNFDEIKEEESKNARAQQLFDAFTEYGNFTYKTDAPSGAPILQGYDVGSCQSFAIALAGVFQYAGIEAQTKTLPQRDFVTKQATNFIDDKCPGNLKTPNQGYESMNRFFFDNHEITTSEAGDFDPTAGVRNGDAVDPALTGFQFMNGGDKETYGLDAKKHYYFKGNTLIEMLPGDAVSGNGYLMTSLT